jgi:hypothetical protein
MYVRKVLELDPENEHARGMVKQLKDALGS